MVTGEHYIKDGVYYGAVTLYGLSDASMPTTFGNGSKFIAVDTGDEYIFDAENKEWHLIGEEPEPTTEGE